MMRVSETGDPRLEALFGAGAAPEAGVRPVVRLPRFGPPLWMIGAAALLAALLLFWILESRRGASPQASVSERTTDLRGYPAAPPPLYIPSQPQAAPVTRPAVQPAPFPVSLPQSRPVAMAPPAPAVPYYPPLPEPPQISEPVRPSRTGAGPALVIDTTAPTAQPGEAPAASSMGPAPGGTATIRVRASGLANRSVTVPQGVLIPAVLETAFNSNHAGFARAIVSRDIRGFDGTRILIPRGSRVIGRYESDVANGQNRALISWTRLIRPDGVTVALESPSVDTLGRGGVRANVNTHFWEQLGGALLRSIVDIGAGIATRAATGPVIVAVPAATQSVIPQQMSRYTPTLSVPAGTSISIFVARDLEFPEGFRK